jgi:hypothetical protein
VGEVTWPKAIGWPGAGEEGKRVAAVVASVGAGWRTTLGGLGHGGVPCCRGTGAGLQRALAAAGPQRQCAWSGGSGDADAARGHRSAPRAAIAPCTGGGRSAPAVMLVSAAGSAKRPWQCEPLLLPQLPGLGPLPPPSLPMAPSEFTPPMRPLGKPQAAAAASPPAGVRSSWRQTGSRSSPGAQAPATQRPSEVAAGTEPTAVSPVGLPMTPRRANVPGVAVRHVSASSLRAVWMRSCGANVNACGWRDESLC